MALENLEPITREEAFLDEIATGELILNPIIREEVFLKMIALGKAGELFPDVDPITRHEYFLRKIAESFSGSLGAPVYHDDLTIEGATTTAQTIATLTLDPPSSAPYVALVVCKAVDPTPGQYRIFVGYSLVNTLASNSSPLSKGGAGSDGASSSGSATGIYISTSSITGAPDTPKHNITLQCKKGSGVIQNLDGDYSLDIYFITA